MSERAVVEIPPANLDAARAVLGAILLEGRAALRQLTLDSEDFFMSAHKDIFAAMRSLDGRGEPVDLITVSAELERRGNLQSVGGQTALALLVEHASILVNLPAYAHLIAEDGQRRRFGELGARLRQGALNGATASELAGWASEILARHRELAARRRPDEAPSELTALLAHRFPPRADVIARGVLPREGLLVVGGKPKVGKSLMLDNLDLQRVRGRPWLGFPTDPGVTFTLNPEVSAPAAVERFRTMLKNDPEPVPEGRLHLKTRRGVLLDTPDGLAQIMAWLEETGADVLRIDPLARAMSGEENSNRDMGAVVRAVDSLIERYGVAVILAHHPGKPSKDQPRTGGDRLRGAGALFAAADTVVMMDKTEDGFTLSFDLRGGREIAPMRVTRTEDLWLVPAGADPELVALAALTAAAPLPYRTLVGAAHEDLKVSEATAKRRIATGLAAGVLAKDLDGLYRPGAAYHEAVSRSHGISSDA